MSNNLNVFATLENLANKFCEYLEVINYSRYTIKHRHYNLRYFTDWCEQREITRPCEIDRYIIERYQSHVHMYKKENGETLAASSQTGRLICVRVFFRWLIKNNIVSYNPTAEIDLPKRERRIPRGILTRQQAELILSRPDITKPLGIRDRAILETFYSTGIRRLELVEIKARGLDIDSGTLLVFGKGSKERLVPVGKRAFLWIEKYLYQVRADLVRMSDPGHLFVSNTGKRLKPDFVSQIVSDYIKAAGIEKQGACHIFRHTFATLMLENGAGIRYIQEMLGHDQLNSTQRYTQVSIAKLKEIHTQYHPAGNPRAK